MASERIHLVLSLGMKETQTQTLCLPNLSISTIKAIKTFIEKEHTKEIVEENVLDVFVGAKFLEIKTLENYCRQYAIDFFQKENGISLENVVDLRKWGNSFREPKIKWLCFDFVRNCDEQSKNKLKTSFGGEHLVSLVKVLSLKSVKCFFEMERFLKNKEGRFPKV